MINQNPYSLSFMSFIYHSKVMSQVNGVWTPLIHQLTCETNKVPTICSEYKLRLHA